MCWAQLSPIYVNIGVLDSNNLVATCAEIAIRRINTTTPKLDITYNKILPDHVHVKNFIVMDAGSSVDLAVQYARQMYLEQNATVLIGPFFSAQSEAVSDAVSRPLQKPFISYGATGINIVYYL